MSSDRKVNLLALPKNPKLWECFETDPDRVIMREDVHSLEPHVMTHMSQDANMLKIYGKGAEPHDIYLFVAAFFPAHKDEVLLHYNLVGNETKERLSEVKEILGDIRDDVKAPYLGWIYGLGAETLAFDKQIPIPEAKKALRAIDRAFPGKDRLHAALLKEWKRNNGWIINGRGRPICVPDDKKRDLVNRCVQSTGHDFLMRILYHRWNYIREHDIDAKPYIPDYQDEILAAVKVGHQQAYRDAVEHSYKALNDELNWSVIFKHGGISEGTSGIVRCS